MCAAALLDKVRHVKLRSSQRKRQRKRILVLGILSLFTSSAVARTVQIGGIAQAAAVDSKILSGTEMLAVWTLPRLGISVRNDPLDTRLLYGSRELRYSPERGWLAVGFTSSTPFPPPQIVNGSLYVPLTALKLLGIRVSQESSSFIDFAAPASVPTATLGPSPERAAPTTPKPATSASPATSAPAPTRVPAPASKASVTYDPSPVPGSTPAPPPSTLPTSTVTQPSQPVANLDTVRVSRTMHRGVEVQRVVLEFSGPATHTVQREKNGLSLLLGGTSASAASVTLSSGDSLTVTPGANGAVVQLGTGGGTSEVFTLENPYRVVIDTTTLLDSSVPPPINPDGLPEGVTYRNRGMLHTLSFDPQKYQPRVVSALPGRSADIATLVRSVQGVGGVNGGYFDTTSALPVDLVMQGGLMTAPSLERRATVGFSASGETMFGYPKPRYVLRGNFPSVLVNTVGPRVRPDLLTAFVGDGRTMIGADHLTTLYVTLNGSNVMQALTGRVVPPAGTLALTFNPQQFPQLPRAAGQPLRVELAWRSSDAPWNTAQEALSAGPLLVSGNRVVIDASKENFNTSAGIWRATRQVALGVLRGQPTIAYFEYGTPEAFAAALAGAGFSSAMRMDSGSSASAYLSRGFGNLGGYLNTVWSQNVPNAIVFVPRTAPLGGKK